MVRQRDELKTTHTVVLKAETYEKLDQYKVKLIGKRNKSSITYDDAINDLLEKQEN